jgi:hypothetical protein
MASMQRMDAMMSMFGGGSFRGISSVDCYLATVTVYDDLVRNPIEGVTPIAAPESHSFRLRFPPGCSVSVLSVSLPSDAHGMIETALFNSENTELIYNSNIGYDDICRFENIEELRAEIQRLLTMVQTQDIC